MRFCFFGSGSSGLGFDKYIRCFEKANLIKKLSDSEKNKLKEKLDIISLNTQGASPDVINIVSLYVDRFSGGERAGRGGILELVEKSILQDWFVDTNLPLVFTPFSG